MILCPHCRHEIRAEKHRLSCASCGKDYPLEDGIVCLMRERQISNVDYDPNHFPRLKEAEDAHFWFRSRRNLLTKCMLRHVPRSGTVLEIGSGTGNIAEHLSELGYDVAISDMHRDGLLLCKTPRITERYQFNLMESPFRDHFDAVTAFDVIEHLPDDKAAVARMHALLKPGGLAVVTVPAEPLLWSGWDIYSGHKRRYRFKEIAALFRNGGFELLELRGIFLSLLPLLFIRKLILPRAGKGPSLERPLRVNPLLNRILYMLLSAENRVLSLPITRGSSILLVARKRQLHE